MIYGIGNDIVDIRRMEQSIRRYGDRFLDRVFSVQERELAARRESDWRSYVSAYAKKFAIKEAFMKALGTGYYKGVHFSKISVVRGRYGKPEVELLGSTLEAWQARTEGKPATISVTVSDEYPYAFAVVVIEIL